MKALKRRTLIVLVTLAVFAAGCASAPGNTPRMGHVNPIGWDGDNRPSE